MRYFIRGGKKNRCHVGEKKVAHTHSLDLVGKSLICEIWHRRAGKEKQKRGS